MLMDPRNESAVVGEKNWIYERSRVEGIEREREREKRGVGRRDCGDYFIS